MRSNGSFYVSWGIRFTFFLPLIFVAAQAFARDSQLGELSVMGSYSKTNYGPKSFATHRRYSTSLALNITVLTQFEVAYSNTDSFYNDDPFQTTTVNEQILSASVVQLLVPPDWMIQFYGKAGAAQYNRKQSGTIYGIPTRNVSTKSPSALLGFGMRVLIAQMFSLKAEGTTYLPDLKFGQIKDNFAVQGGLGWHF